MIVPRDPNSCGSSARFVKHTQENNKKKLYKKGLDTAMTEKRIEEKRSRARSREARGEKKKRIKKRSEKLKIVEESEAPGGIYARWLYRLSRAGVGEDQSIPTRCRARITRSLRFV